MGRHESELVHFWGYELRSKFKIVNFQHDVVDTSVNLRKTAQIHPCRTTHLGSIALLLKPHQHYTALLNSVITLAIAIYVQNLLSTSKKKKRGGVLFASQLCSHNSSFLLGPRLPLLFLGSFGLHRVPFCPQRIYTLNCIYHLGY